MITDSEFVSRAILAASMKTLYVMGAFGAPLNDKNKARYKKNNSYNKQEARQKKIDAATADTFAFDCVGLIKGILWGWDANVAKIYGGAKYKSNGVPDTNVDGMLKKCSGISTDFTNILPGEYLWTNGHCGIYIGEGLAIESTPIWKDGVQITACNYPKQGYHLRKWQKHGMLPYIDYNIAPEWQPTVGENVFFNGSTHYTNANATNGKQCNPGPAVIKRIYRLGKSKHPYKIKGIKPCTANGWVDTEDILKIE